MVLRVLVSLLLIGGCESGGSEFLMNARNFLLIDEKTFEERLKERFIVDQLGELRATEYLPFEGPRYSLPGQNIIITYQATDPVDLLGIWGKSAKIARDHNLILEKKAAKEQTSIIGILLPYKVSKSTAIKMLGYLSRLLGECSEGGLWRDEGSEHTITVTHFDEFFKTRIMVSVAASKVPIRGR